MNRFLAEVLLLLVTIIWGLAFVWQMIASRVLGALTVVGLRSLIAVIFIVLVALILPTLYKSQNPKILHKSSQKKGIFLAILCGLVLFFAMYIQQIGLAMTTAGKAGFISVLYICVVPLISVFFGSKLSKPFVIGLILAIIGFYLLSVKEQFTLEVGDLIVLASAILFGVHILVIGYASVKVNSMLLSIIQLAVVAVLSLTLAFFKETITWQAISSVAGSLLALGILSSGVAYTLQIIGQREIPAHTASLIMSFESVVAALGGVIILGEHVGYREALGMFIVFIGILISQMRVKKKVDN